MSPLATTATGANVTDNIRSQLPTLRAGCETAFADTPVFVAYVYGSRAWGRPRSESDLDIGYYCLPGSAATRLPLPEELRLAGLLSDAVGYEVDLRCLGDAPLDMRGRVLEEGHRVYASDEVARVNLERDLLGRYHDYKPKLAEWLRLRFASLAARAGV